MAIYSATNDYKAKRKKIGHVWWLREKICAREKNTHTNSILFVSLSLTLVRRAGAIEQIDSNN